MRIIIADHHMIFREGLAGLLSADPDTEVIGISGNSKDAVEKTISLHPDILLLDLDLPDGGGLDAIKTVSIKSPEIVTIVLTAQFTDELLLSAVRKGAKGYLLKDIPTDHLIEALKAVLRNEAAFSRIMTRKIIDEIARISDLDKKTSGFDQLTVRELEVVEQICNGSSNQEIAAFYGISENTVKAHVRKILEKLQLRNRREVKRLAQQQGFPSFSTSSRTTSFSK